MWHHSLRIVVGSRVERLHRSSVEQLYNIQCQQQKKTMSSSMDKQVFRRTTVQYILCQQQKNHELEYGQNEHQNNITTRRCNNKCLQHPDTKLDTLQLLL
jgi:AICAR transformylase/IMP cyclohydrolase PurH